MTSLERLNRLRARIEDATIAQYIIRDLKSPQEFEDQICDFFVWIWSLKDHIKVWLRNATSDPKIVEETADSSQDLKICADIANMEKHSKSKPGRSGLWPRLGSVGFSAPQDDLKRLTFGADSVEIQFQKPEWVNYRVPILDRNGNELGDAMEIASRALECWEFLLSKCGILSR